MRSADCSPEIRGAAAAKPEAIPLPRHGRFDLLWALAPVVGRAGMARGAAYALLSLIAALAGSVAAIVLVPLIQSGRAPVFGGRLPVLAGDSGTLTAIFSVSIGCYVLLRWFAARLAARVISDSAMRLRGRVHARLIDADISALGGSSSAEIANVLTANVELVTQGIGATSQLLMAGLTTAVNLAFAFWLSPVPTLVLPALAGLGIVALRWHGREQSRISRQYVKDMTRLFWFSEDFPRRLRHVRSFEREDAERTGYGTISASLAHAYRRQIELTISGKLIVELFAAVGMVGIFLVAGRWHGIDQASLIAVGLLLGRLLPYIASTRHNLQQVRLAVPAFQLWQRYATMDGVRRETQPVSAGGSRVPGIHIEHVRLRRSSLRVDVEGLWLVPGEMTLVAGDSGIGKSSLADVLAGMAVPASFAASAGGRPLDFDGYRQLVHKGAYVSQSVRPWQHTIRECLLWAAPDATGRQLRAALTDVGLDQRWRHAHGGLAAELQGACCRLSGGELQRLLLAQVILRQPFLAILDEATGALDAGSEMDVLATLRRRLPQTILIVVSHREGPLAIADQCLRIGSGGAANMTRAALHEVSDRMGAYPHAEL